MEEFPSLKKKHFSLRFHYLLKAFLEMLMRIKNKQIQLKIIYWTSTKHLDSMKTREMKRPGFNSNNLTLRGYKDK